MSESVGPVAPVYGPACAADVEGIQQVAAAGWHATYAGVFPPEYIEARLALDYGREALLEWMRDPVSLLLVARVGERVVGYCLYGDRGEGAELIHLYVAPDAWRRGVGSRLVYLLEVWLRQRGQPEYFCYVNTRNARGQAFYRKLGFVRVPERDLESDWYLRRVLGRGAT